MKKINKKNGLIKVQVIGRPIVQMIIADLRIIRFVEHGCTVIRPSTNRAIHWTLNIEIQIIFKMAMRFQIWLPNIGWQPMF